MNALEEAVQKASEVATQIYEEDEHGSHHLVAIQIPIEAWMGIHRLLLPDFVERPA